MSKSTQVYEYFLRAKPEQVWSALTKPEVTEKYFFGTRVELEAKPGGKLEYRLPNGMLMMDGQVKAAEPKAKLVASWRIHYDPSARGETSTVTWQLEPRGDYATKLTLTHELEEAPNTAESVGEGGWSLVLSALKTLLETNAPLQVGPPD
jgi:uncharacterized protein YndB with AHSA1/START domain